ncbi:aldose 1-epimerase family protein [uncultured Marivita sp.]|uniref:aldose 1-epimerase family protein n=1 Tax=uncultured Marivita sp. TaxID=888080 RepID=UPI0026033B7A|nr:aldose 1-epimerase family protein [uncultured Marivita sp.]
MTEDSLEDLRRRSVHLRSEADIRLVEVIEGCGAGGRVLELRTPLGLAVDLALDRAGDILRLSWRGTELGWHGPTSGRTPWPVADTEDGLGFLRGFDGFLVTCGLDHHGVATTTPADSFLYPLRERNQHPLHGRIYREPAELLERNINWDDGEIRVQLRIRQATVFGEVLELNRTYSIGLDAARIAIEDTVINRGFRPTRHGILYHVNVGHPLLGEASKLSGDQWLLVGKLPVGVATPCDNHVEIVDVDVSPADGRIGIENPRLGIGLRVDFDPEALPATALWQAFQSGVFALGLEPQTVFDNSVSDRLAPGDLRTYRVSFTIESS